MPWKLDPNYSFLSRKSPKQLLGNYKPVIVTCNNALPWLTNNRVDSLFSFDINYWITKTILVYLTDEKLFGWISLDLHLVTYCLPFDYTHHSQTEYIWIETQMAASHYFFCAACLILGGNQLGENKQNNLSIIEDNLQLNYGHFQTIKLFASIHYKLFVMWRLSP